ncbi:MAG: hypothetical protein KF784_14860 [Fimbriimonadaceae bacterium]|nr:hypothetical protein [Fimbriimonadaceae bacterium]
MAISWLPWAVIAIGVASLFVRSRTDSEDSSRANPLGLVIVSLALLAAVFGLTRLNSELILTLYGAAVGCAVGILMATVLDRLLQRAVSSVGFAIGALVVAAVSFATVTTVQPDHMPLLLFGVALGLGGIAWASSGCAASVSVSHATLACVAVSAADQLGRIGPGNYAKFSGQAFGLVAAICAVLVLGVVEGHPKRRSFAPILIAILMTGAGWLITQRVLELQSIWTVLGGSAVAACVVHYLLPEDDKGSFGFMLATLIWLGVATLAFGVAKGFGMSVAALGGLAICVSMRNGRALLSMSPLLALVLYRMFRELFSDSGRALDIAQHYGLVGILIGAAVPILAWEWWLTAHHRVGIKRDIAAGLWCILMVSVPMLVTVLLSSKGYVGWLAGLGISSVILGLKGEKSSTPMALAMGFAALSSICFMAFKDYINLVRETKVIVLGWAFGIFIVVAILIWFLSVRSEGAPTKEGQ